MPGFPVSKGVPADSRIEENGGRGRVEQVAPFEDNSSREQASGAYHTVNRTLRPGEVNVGLAAASETTNPLLQMWLEERISDAPWNSVSEILVMGPRVGGHPDQSAQPGDRLSQSSVVCVGPSVSEAQNGLVRSSSQLAEHVREARQPRRGQRNKDQLAATSGKEPSEHGGGLEDDHGVLPRK